MISAGAEILTSAQQADHVGIDVECGHRRAATQQRPGERTRPRPDFEHAVSRCLDRQPRDADGRAAVHQEMLAKPFLRPDAVARQERARMKLGAALAVDRTYFTT